MAREGERDRDRDRRGRERETRGTEAGVSAGEVEELRRAVDSQASELRQTKDQLGRVGRLAVLTSKDVGEMRSQMQLVVFLAGAVKEFVAGVLQTYVDGRARVQAGQEEKGQPLKCRIYDAVLSKLLDVVTAAYPQAAGKIQELVALKAEYDVIAVANASRPPEDAGKPWVVVVTFSGSDRGHQMRGLWLSTEIQQAFKKQNGEWPSISARAGSYRAGRLTQDVAADVGLDIGGKGRGKGGGVKRRSETPPPSGANRPSWQRR